MGLDMYLSSYPSKLIESDGKKISIDYDKEYYDSIILTLNKVESILEKNDFNKKAIVYYSSWKNNIKFQLSNNS